MIERRRSRFIDKLLRAAHFSQSLLFKVLLDKLEIHFNKTQSV